MIALLKPEPGVLVLGKLVGHREPGEYVHPGHGPMYRHDEESFRRLWKEAGEETGTNWDVDVTSRKPGQLLTETYLALGMNLAMSFCVRRV